MALRPENRAQLEHLRHADPGLILALLGLSLATLIINGLLFWAMLAPVRRLSVADTLATNALCNMVAYLPLKLGAVTRVLIHNRRDRVHLATIGAWFAAMVAAMGVAYAPPLLATVWLGRISPAWFAVVLALELAGGAALIFFARIFRGTRGLDRLATIAGAVPLLPLGRALRTRLWGNLHAGFDMLASPAAVDGSLALRLLDIAVHATRFAVAASILGVVLPPAQAIPISVAYFLIGIVSPSGLAGLREGAASGLAGLLLAKTGTTREAAAAFAPVALLVSATEAAVFVGFGLLGLAWLRPHRLLGLRASGARAPSAPAAAPPRATVPPGT